MMLTINDTASATRVPHDNGHLTMDEANEVLVTMLACASRHPFAFWFFRLHGMPPADEIAVFGEDDTELCKHQTGWLRLRHAICAWLKCGKEDRS